MNKMKVYLSLGTNRGDRGQLLLKACAMLRQRLSDKVEASSLYESDPWGFKDQVSFYNMAVSIETVLSAPELLKEIHEIEFSLGRIRALNTVHRAHDSKRIYEPRIIDIDVLFYGLKIISDEDLIIPHPRLHERRFILVAMVELAPGLVHPALKKTIKELLASCQDTGRVKCLA